MGSNAVRYMLATLLVVVALNAFAGGYYALSGAPGVPVEWLEGSGFADYTVPGWILLVVVGGSAAVGAAAVIGRRGFARASAVAAGVVLLGWIVTQVAIIGYVSWLQPAMAIVAATIVLLGYRYREAP